jgi:hypothetical protein
LFILQKYNPLRKSSEFWQDIIHSSWQEFILLCSLAFTCLVIFSVYTDSVFSNKTPIYLAQSFLHGRTYFAFAPNASTIPFLDVAIFNGHYYWPGGPMVGIVAIPLALATFLEFSLGHLQLLINAVVILLLYQLTSALDVRSRTARLIFCPGFVAATNYCAIAMERPIMTSTQQLITTMFTLAGLLLFLKQKNPFWIGCAVAAAFLTRFSLVGFIPFFPLTLIHAPINRSQKKRQLWLYSSAIFIGLMIFLFYNYLRFGNIFESGYHYQTISSVFISDMQTKGLFNLAYLPANLYYLLIKMPDLVFNALGNHAIFPYLQSNPWGMSIFITSPFLVFFLFTKTKFAYVRYLKYCSLLTLLPMLFYYGIGWTQYGYRYAIDIYPMLFVVAITASNSKITSKVMWTMIAGMIATWWFVLIQI